MKDAPPGKAGPRSSNGLTGKTKNKAASIPLVTWTPSPGGAFSEASHFSEERYGFREEQGNALPLVENTQAARLKKSKTAPAKQEKAEAKDKNTGKTPSTAKQDQPHYIGHRQRLRERFAKSEAGIADYELLELLLFRSIARGDVKGTAKALIARFGALSEVLAAPPERLMEVPGVGPAVAHDLKVVEAAGRRLAHGAVINRQVLGSWSSVIDYCRASMAFAEREELRLLFLDKKNGLMADEVMQKGTVDHTPVYPREIIRRALTLNSSAVILVHNHPTGDPTPSRADIEMTREIIALAEPLGIVVHDHLIIGRKGHASFRALGLL